MTRQKFTIEHVPQSIAELLILQNLDGETFVMKLVNTPHPKDASKVIPVAMLTSEKEVSMEIVKEGE